MELEEVTQKLADHLKTLDNIEEVEEIFPDHGFINIIFKDQSIYAINIFGVN